MRELVGIRNKIYRLNATLRRSKNARSRRKPIPRARRKRHRHPWRRIFIKLGLAAVLLWLLVAGGFYLWALTFDLNRIRDLPERSVILDRDNAFYSRLAGENRIVAPFDKISNDFVNALITREDRRFYSHRGVDPIGIARAAVRNLLFGGIRQGASTITQQLARNSFPLGGRNYGRKLIEAALAFRIETELTKEQILDAYMNRIYFGAGCYGIETASRTYFEKPASRLALDEAAMMAGLIRSPSRLNPFNDYEGAMEQRDVVLRKMFENGFINADTMHSALAIRTRIASNRRPSYQQNWAMETVERELDLVLDREQLASGGLQVFTTIDPVLQDGAEASVKRRLAQIEKRAGYPHPAMNAKTDRSADSTPYLQGAVLVIDNRTGGICAIVGGRDYTDSRFNRAVLSRRQVGSTAKPFLYAMAFEQGIDPNAPVSDRPIMRSEIPRQFQAYDPKNADDTYSESIRVGEALVHSRNPASVRLGLHVGLEKVADGFLRAGIARDVDPLPSLSLGAFESTLKDLTAAYTAFATGGVRLQPYIIREIRDANGRVLFKATQGRIRFLSEDASESTARLLSEVLTRGTGSKARSLGYTKSGGGKTGTTNDSIDAWFVGFHASLTCGVWVGFDQPRTIYPSAYGADLALPIWVDVMNLGSSQRYPDR